MDLKCGYLDFRNPAKESWYTVRLWVRKWVEARVNTASEGRSVLLEAYEDQNEFDKTVVCILLEKVTAVRRAPIKNRYALEIFSGDRPMVYLSANSESLCHEWISVLKRALLPSMSAIRKLPDVGSVFHHVWALPVGSAAKLRLNGEFLLAITGDSFLLYNETGALCLEWKLNQIRRFAVCNDKDIPPADYGKILYIHTGSDCQDGEGEYYFYSIQAKDILQQMLDKIGEAMEKIKISQQREGRDETAQQATDGVEDKTSLNKEWVVENDDVDGEGGKGEEGDNASVNTSISWTSESSEGSNAEKTCQGTVSATTVNDSAEVTPGRDLEKETPAGSMESTGDSDSVKENARTPPDGYDHQPGGCTRATSSPQSVQPLANDDTRKDFAPMAASPSNLSGTLLYPSPAAARARGNSTGSSGYGSDPLEINGLTDCYRLSSSGQSVDSNSVASASDSSVSFADKLPKVGGFQSEPCTFSLSSGPQGLTKTRRNTFSGGNDNNHHGRDREQITEADSSRRKRVIPRRLTLSSINELYRFCDDRFNQDERSFLKNTGVVVQRKSSIDSLVNSSFDEFETNDAISDTSVDEHSADIPAPFDLLDIYSLSARARLVKDSETAGDRGGADHSASPPSLSARTSSLRATPPAPSTENKPQKTKAKRPTRRRSSIFTSIAERLLQSTGASSKKKDKEASKAWSQSRSKSCPSSPTSSPTLKRKPDKENGKSSKYKINLRWSKNKKQYKSCQSLDRFDCSSSSSTTNSQEQQPRPNSFHGSNSVLKKLSKQDHEILMKYCPDPLANSGPVLSPGDRQSHLVPVGEPIMNTSSQSEPRTHARRKQRIQSLDDMDGGPVASTRTTWKSMEGLAKPPSPYKAKTLPRPKRNSIRDTVKTGQTNSTNSHSTHLNQSTSPKKSTPGPKSTHAGHRTVCSTEKTSGNKLSIKSRIVDDDVFDGYIDMKTNLIESDEEFDNYYTNMNRT